jgi:malonyl-CoA/methylmalonyl-CoA synthetase
MSNPLYDALFGGHLGREAAFLRLADGSVMSYAGFLGLAARLAHAVTGLGLVAGDRVAVQAEKSPEMLALYAACVQAGLVFLPLNTGYTTQELRYFIEDSGAKLLVCDPAKRAALAPLAAAQGARLETLDALGQGSLRDLAAGQAEVFATVARRGEDLAALLYTSGTTGRSKGAMLSQNNLLSNAQTLVQAWRFTAEDVLLHALPIFHTHGLFVATNVTLLAGSSMIFLPRFDLGAVLKHLPQASVLMGVPTFYTRLLEAPEFTAELASHLRLFISGSAPLLAETHAQFEARTGQRILERYGMTETNMNTSNPYDGERREGTVGLALPGVEVRVCDADGVALPAGEVGMIEVRGPNVFQGYWQMPEKTKAELRADGFFITGDLGVIDAAGYVSIVGRGKDLIISGGYNIYPKEIELVLDDQPGVLESAVIGVPDPDLGEVALGVLVAERGATLDLAAIMARVQTALARFKHPRRLVVIDELPRNTMGKVQKNLLRAQIGDQRL